MSGPSVSIVVLTHDGREHVATCLASLAADGWPSPDVEVLLVDNGSTDGTEAFVRAEFPSVRLLSAGRNLGFAPGVRLGAEAGRGETLVLLNNDTRVEKGWLSSLVSALEAAPPEVAAVTGRIVSWDGTRFDYRDTLLAFDGHAFQKDFGRPLAEVSDDPPGAARVAPCGGNMAIRREAFLASGGFDDDFFAYLEDVDLGLRLASRGLATVYEPRAVVRHRSGATGEALGIYNRGFLIEKNAFAVFWANFDEAARHALLPAVLLTFLHRLERIVREKAPDGGIISLDPYRPGEAPPRREGRRRAVVRLVEKALGLEDRRPSADLADPHTLSQLRALHRIAIDLPRLERKRAENERLRRVPSEEIFARFPLHLVPTYPGDAELFASEAFRALLPERPALKALSLAEVMA